MVNIFSPENSKLTEYTYDTLYYYLDKYNVKHESNSAKDGYLLFELVHMHDIEKIPGTLTLSEKKRVQSGSVKILLFFAREPIGYYMVFNIFDKLAARGYPHDCFVMVTGNVGELSMSSFNGAVKAVPLTFFDMTTAEKYKGRTEVSKNPSKKFLCFNSVVKLHRSIMNILLPEGDGYISYLKRKYTDDEYLHNEVDRYEMPNDVRKSAHNLIESEPKILDMTLRECIGDQFDDDYSLYDDSALSIVTESLYCDRSLFLTEKTFKPILSMHPFIIVSSPGVHEYIRSLGYKTYDFLIPEIEKIDKEYDLYKRASMIADAVKNFNIDTYFKNIKEIEAVALHNRRTCLSNNYKERLEKLLKELE